MAIVIHEDVVQGSAEWLELRRGKLTASEMKLILTPTFKAASNENERKHLYSLMAQRLAGYVEPGYEGEAMLRGYEDEMDARALYEQHYGPVRQVAFVTNDKFGFTIGCSPDGLINDDGGLECKSRVHKLHLQSILEHMREGTAPTDFVMQVQTCLLVTERKWWDFVSYSAGLPMATWRCYPDEKIQQAIVDVAMDFEIRLARKTVEFQNLAKDYSGQFIPTERRMDRELFV